MSNSSQASQRIAALLDDNSFVEIGAMVTARATDFDLKQTETPSDGVITGYGVIDGNLVYVYSQDASVLNGTVGEMHAKKIANLYDLALKTGAPVIGLIDSAGLRLQEATDALNAFGEIYMKQTMASGVIPQISLKFSDTRTVADPSSTIGCPSSTYATIAKSKNCSCGTLCNIFSFIL